MENRSVEITVNGRVQGVGYRYSARNEAVRRNIRGWVRNEYDGGVLLRAEGKKSDIDSFISWCKKGPPYAHVTGVKIIEMEYQGNYQDFGIKY